jgi:hypothetical protein
MGAIQFDDSRWPIVVVRYPHVIDPRDWDAHMARVVGYVKQDQPWGMINDSRGAARPTATQRQGIVNMYDDHENLVRKNWRATAIVFDSQLVVGVLTALSWARPLPHPFKSFTDYDEGASWIEGMFRPGELPARPLPVA